MTIQRKRILSRWFDNIWKHFWGEGPMINNFHHKWKIFNDGSILSVLAVLSRVSRRGSPVAGVPSRESRRGSPVAGVPSRESRPTVPSRQSRPSRPVPAVPSRQSRHGSPVPAVPSRQSRPGSPVPAVPSRQSRPGSPVPAVPSRQSRLGSPVFVLCPVLADFFWLSSCSCSCLAVMASHGGVCSTYLRLDTSTKCLNLFYTSPQAILG